MKGVSESRTENGISWQNIGDEASNSRARNITQKHKPWGAHRAIQTQFQIPSPAKPPFAWDSVPSFLQARRI